MHDFKVGDKIVLHLQYGDTPGTIYTVGPSDDMDGEALDDVAYTFMADDDLFAGLPEPIFEDDDVELLA